MSRLLLRLTASLLLCLALFSACRNNGVAPATMGHTQLPPDTLPLSEVSADEGAIFQVVEGLILWSGQPAFGKPHTGSIRVSGGELIVSRSQLLSGTVTIDMQSIAVTDLADGGERRDLEGHLKHADFFDADEYPVGKFTFEEVLPSNLPEFNWVVSGTLTMKGKTNPVNIPVKITVQDGELVAQSPSFPINRTQWGINFRSSLLGTAKDKLIQDVIVLSLKLKGQKSI